jgi:hypothetical protein
MESHADEYEQEGRHMYVDVLFFRVHKKTVKVFHLYGL